MGVERNRTAGLVAALALATAGCGGAGTVTTAGGVPKFPDGTPPEVKANGDAWPAPNGDLANTRSVPSAIDSGNVSTLGVAWTAPITALGYFGGYATTPLIADGTVYTQDLDSNVFAYDLETGRKLWEHRYDSKCPGPNGVALGYGRVYGATATFAFAVDAGTGEEVWRSKELTRNGNEGIDVQAAVFDGKVFVSTVPLNVRGIYKGDGVGVLYALDADTGEEVWHFDTVPRDLWSPAHKAINSGGGVWFPPGFDDEGNVYAAVANPAPWPGTDELPWGTSRPGPNLYTNSLVKLDGDTGELLWFNQVLPHDLYDWDLHLSPVLAQTGGRKVVIVAGKMGYVFAMDAATGKTIWKTIVGKHNGHDDDNLAALAGNLSALPKLPALVYPGTVGGVETPLAVDGDTVYASVVNLGSTYVTQTRIEMDHTKGSGELVALDLATGEIEWVTKIPRPAYGSMTVTNDLVFTNRLDGVVLALDKATGELVWQRRLPTSTNASLAIAGDTLVTAASYPFGPLAGQPQIVAFRLGAGR